MESVLFLRNPFNILRVVNVGWRWDFSSRNFYWRPLQINATTFMNTSMIRYMRVTGTFPARVTTYQFYRLRDIKGAETWPILSAGE